jgi:hypothetical protein
MRIDVARFAKGKLIDFKLIGQRVIDVLTNLKNAIVVIA